MRLSRPQNIKDLKINLRLRHYDSSSAILLLHGLFIQSTEKKEKSANNSNVQVVFTFSKCCQLRVSQCSHVVTATVSDKLTPAVWCTVRHITHVHCTIQYCSNTIATHRHRRPMGVTTCLLLPHFGDIRSLRRASLSRLSRGGKYWIRCPSFLPPWDSESFC